MVSATHHPSDPRTTLLARAGGVSALAVAATLLGGLAGLALVPPGPTLRNWLVLLFEINAGLGPLPADALHVPHLLDFAVLVLVGTTCLGLWPVLGKVSRVGVAVAASLPVVGIAVLLVTELAGRSSVMAAGLVVALLMLKDDGILKPLAGPGILANVLLLAGDVGTRGSRAPVVAVLLGAGYLLLAAWFLLIGIRVLGGRRSDVRPQAGECP